MRLCVGTGFYASEPAEFRSIFAFSCVLITRDLLATRFALLASFPACKSPLGASFTDQFTPAKRDFLATFRKTRGLWQFIRRATFPLFNPQPSAAEAQVICGVEHPFACAFGCGISNRAASQMHPCAPKQFWPFSRARHTYSRRQQPNPQPPQHFRHPRSPQLFFAPANEQDTSGPFGSTKQTILKFLPAACHLVLRASLVLRSVPLRLCVRSWRAADQSDAWLTRSWQTSSATFRTRLEMNWG